jgi:hypothetical protein
MAKMRRTTPPLKRDEDQIQEVASDTDWPATPTTDATIAHEVPEGSTQPTNGSIVTRNGKLGVDHPKYTGLPYFQTTKANVKNITDPDDICWERDFGHRDILCWTKQKNGSRKDVQLIVVGKIKTADLGEPNGYGKYTIDLHIDEEDRQAFNTIWKTGKWANTPANTQGYSVPVSDQGVARFTAKLETINREAQEEELDLVLTEHDPFPGLHNGSGMHKDSTTLTPHPAHEFTEGATVAVEATVATYKFTSEDGIRRFGYSLGIREVYWLCEYRSEGENEDGRNGNPTTPKKRKRLEGEWVSPRSFRRESRVATFDPFWIGKALERAVR